MTTGHNTGPDLAALAYAAVADMRAIAEELHEPTDAKYSPLRRAADRLAEGVAAALPPLVLVNITGGVEQDSYTFAGIGEPIVHVRDFEHEGRDADDLAWLADEGDEWAALIRARSTHPDDLRAADTYAADAAELRQELEEDRNPPHTYKNAQPDRADGYCDVCSARPGENVAKCHGQPVPADVR